MLNREKNINISLYLLIEKTCHEVLFIGAWYSLTQKHVIRLPHLKTIQQQTSKCPTFQ